MAGADALPLPQGVPADLTAASSTLTRVADRVSQTQIYQHGGSAPMIADSWQGAAKSSRVTEANRLRGRISHAARRLPSIGTALTTYEGVLSTTVEHVRQWQRQWDDAQDAYLGQLRRVNNQPFPEEDRQSIANSYADERDAEHRRLLRLYVAAMLELRTAGRNAATTIRGECDLVVPPEAAGSRLEIGAHVLRDLPLSGGEAMSELAAELAPELVDALRPAVAAGDPDALAAILEQYGQYAEDPYFAHAVMSELEADGLMSVVNDLAIANLRHGGDDALRDRQQEVMGFLGTLYAAASGSAGGDIPDHGYDHEAITEWREDVWFDALTTSGRAVHEFGDDGFAGGVYDGYWVQGLLLASGAEAGVTPGAEYMARVGQDMVAWDLERGAANDQRDWDFAAPFHRANLIGYEDDYPLAVLADDPVYALLHAASQDTDATHALLLSEVPSRHDEVTNVVEYLVQERGGTMAYSQPFADQGALLAETVAAHGTDRTDTASTELASDYLHAYIDTVAKGTFADGTELSEHAFASARTGTADVVVAHVEDFIRTTTNPDGPNNTHGPGDEPGTRQIHFDTDMRDKFGLMFGDLALDRPDQIVTADNPGAQDNPPALQRVVNAAVAHNAIELNTAFTNPQGDPIVVMDRGANFLISVTENAGQGRMGMAEAQDAYNQYLQKVVKAGAGMVPVGSIPVVGQPADAAYGLATDAILERIIATDNADNQVTENANVRQEVRALLEQQGKMALAYGGTWEEGKDPVTWAANNHLSATENFIHDGELMPMDEILDGDKREDAFFIRFLNAQDGGAGALRELYDQIQQAIGAETVNAETDHDANG